MFSRQKNLCARIYPIIKRYSSDKKLVNVSVNEKSGVAVVTMQRLPVNGLNLELITDLSSTIDELESNKCRGMILTSVGITYINLLLFQR